MSNLTTLLNKYKALVIFDTETSGLDFDKDQIIELAALRVERTASGGLRIAGKMDTFVKLPEGETLPENIVSLTGITDTLLQTEGVQPAKAASQIAKLMQPGPVLMIAHNAQFDACFLRGLLRGAKVGRIDWLDSLTVYKDRRPYGRRRNAHQGPRQYSGQFPQRQHPDRGDLQQRQRRGPHMGGHHQQGAHRPEAFLHQHPKNRRRVGRQDQDQAPAWLCD